MRMRRTCVFCGANAGATPAYVVAARAVGARLAQSGIGVVYGGGGLGLMGAVARGALDAGGEVIGVIPESLLRFEPPPGFLTELRIVRSMHERKAMMVELADAFVALPGGLGTLDEISEVLTWAQLGLHSKPCGLLNLENYFDLLMAWLDHATAQRFIREEHRAMVIIDNELDRLLDRLARYVAPKVSPLIDPSLV
ncbi:MAG: TIGR00730 family Rossman fold protein [Burkholderiales bacterium]